MPSKQRGDKLRGIIKNIWDETFKYESKEQVLTNWVQYDQAHIHRSGKSTIMRLDAIVPHWPRKAG